MGLYQRFIPMPASSLSHYARWYPAHSPLLAVPPELRYWLTASGSLTRQLTQLAGGEFRVQPFHQRFERIFWHESQLMNIPAHQQAWVREVYLYGSQSHPWVKARSVIPVSSLKGQGLRLRFLGTKSLGSLLFKRTAPQCIRQIACLPEGWSRRSLYLWHQQPLIVQETFLPQFQQFLLSKNS